MTTTAIGESSLLSKQSPRFPPISPVRTPAPTSSYPPTVDLFTAQTGVTTASPYGPSRTNQVRSDLPLRSPPAGDPPAISRSILLGDGYLSPTRSRIRS